MRGRWPEWRELRRALSSQPRRAPALAWAALLAALERRRHPLPPAPAPAPAEDDAALPEFPLRLEPAASIIVPVFNQFELTLACLRSLAGAHVRCGYEVVLVDDASGEPDMARLRDIPGLVYLRNEANLGFVGSCNAGAAVARAPVIVFLNNDTLVTTGWLDRLLATLDEPGNGLVGACLLYPDGRLQEAGGLVFADGSGWNYGRGGHPLDPRYRYRRPTDYCSGAAIAISRRLFRQLGGFHARYAPAYYEDTDLAMAVRAAGLRVVVEPAAQVVHLEGASAGTDLSRGMKAHQVVNEGRFRQAWQAQLAARHAPPGCDPDMAARRVYRRRVWIVCAAAAGHPADVDGLALALAARGCGVDLHLLLDWPDDRMDRLRAAGVCVWPREWRASARWYRMRTAAELDAIIDDGSQEARGWVAAESRRAPRAARLSLGTEGPGVDALLQSLERDGTPVSEGAPAGPSG